MTEIDFAAVRRQIHTDRVIPLTTLLADGTLPDLEAKTLEALKAQGYIVHPLQAKATGRSRHTVCAPMLLRDEDVAGLPPHTLVQYAGMAVARRRLQIAPDGLAWRVQAQQTVRRTCEGQLLQGTVPDGYWHQPMPGGRERLWIVEYSSGSYSRNRLRAKLRAYGPNPQLWITPSTAHSNAVEELLEDTFTAPPPYRVVTINWMGAPA